MEDGLGRISWASRSLGSMPLDFFFLWRYIKTKVNDAADLKELENVFDGLGKRLLIWMVTLSRRNFYYQIKFLFHLKKQNCSIWLQNRNFLFGK